MSFPPGGESLSDFYDHTATHTPVGGGAATTIDGNYYPEYVDPFGVLEAQKNVFRCALAAVATWAHGDTLVISAVTYLVKEVKRNHPTQTEVLLLLRL